MLMVVKAVALLAGLLRKGVLSTTIEMETIFPEVDSLVLV